MDREKLGSAAVVAALGLIVLVIPVFDITQDVFRGGKSLLSTVVENAMLLLLSLSIVGVSVWMATSDWDSTYTRTVARISALNAIGITVLVGLVVLIQVEFQDDLKPFIIAADAVLIGTIAGVALGVRTAQQEQANDKATAQRDRFQALFDNVPNPIVGVEFVGDVPIVRAVNPAFTDVFGVDRDTIIGSDLERHIVPPDQELDPVEQPISQQSHGDEEAWDSDIVELETVDGRREFIRLTAPVDRSPARDGYAMYIDVTVQRQRRERLRVLSRTLRHDIRNKLTVVMGIDTVTDQLTGSNRKIAEKAAEAAEEIHAMSEATRQIENQVAGEAEPSPRDITTVVADVADDLRSEYPDATIEHTAPESSYGNVTNAFATAVEGIVRNAVEHNDASAPRVEITVAESLDSEYIDVRVADNGPGIDPEIAEIAKGELETDQKTVHLDGLGLWTARWVMQNSGGDLEFSSNSPRGTIVTLRIPATSADRIPQ